MQIHVVEKVNIDQQFVQNQQANSDVNKAYWLDLASNAWQYYQPGVGLDPSSGLHYATLSYRGFTDWDLGVYIQAIVDAAKLGIITNDGNWGFDYRIDKVLTFLENRPLDSNGAPYLWYSSTDGENIFDSPQIAADAGNLLAALKNVEIYRPALANRVDNIVKTRTDYESLKQAVDALSGSTNIYDYYVTRAFASFWPDRFASQAKNILNNIINAPTIEYQGVTLPRAKLMCEPLLLAIFEFQPDTDLMNLAKQVYLAHEARYNVTGKYAAFSEGSASGVAEYYIWEWVVTPNGNTWIVQKDEFTEIQITPIVFLKAAVGLSALYNTEFTQNMVNDIAPILRTETGYYEGISELGQIVSSTSDKTNSMIITAARYAVDNNTTAPSPPQPTTPTTNLTPSPTITDSTPSQTPETSTNLPTSSLPPTSNTPSSSATSDLPTSTPSLNQPTSTHTLPSINPSPSTSIDIDELPQYIIIAAFAIPACLLLLVLIIFYHKRKQQNQPSEINKA